MASHIISVFSNKGGVGNTFVAVNLATALALAKQRVLVVDLDSQAGQDMGRMLNLTPRYALAEIFAFLESSQEPSAIKKYVTTHSSGLDFVPFVRHTKQIGHVSPENIKIFLKKASSVYDYIIIDSGKIFSENLVTVFDYSNLILLVATPDILAVYQVKWCLEVLQSLQFPLKMVKIVLNRSESRGSVAWQEVKSALSCEIMGHIPSDGKVVGMALNRGIPCVIDDPKSKVSEAFYKMVAQFNKEDIFVPTTEIERKKSSESMSEERPGEFWEKVSISQAAEFAGSYMVEEDELIALKRKIHEKLVERLNLEGITPEALTDSKSAQKIKKSAEEVVGNLLMEEAGGKITSHQERIQLVKDIINEALGLGPLEEFLADSEITDIMVNNKNEIYTEKRGRLILTNRKFVSDEKLRAVIDRIIAPLGRRIDESTPMVDARLPDGSRINAIIPPLSLGGPMLTVRKFGKERIKIEELLNKHKSLSQAMSDFLNACVIGRKNIIVSGGTGAGKTTLLNIVSEFIPDNERIITIEDAAELKLKKSHWARLESRPSNIEGKGEVAIRDLFVNSLRMRPDRIIIGECRGPEVLDMLQAMNTGHDGSMTTLHANSTRDVMVRLSSMILLSGIELPVRAINEMVASAIDLIVQISRFSDGSRKITGISEVLGLDKEHQVELRDVFVFKQKGVNDEGVVLGDFEPTGHIPHFYEDIVTRGIPLDKKIFLR